MLLARKARSKQFTKVSYGENEEHPDLEHLEESSEEESSDDEVIVPAHANIVKGSDFHFCGLLKNFRKFVARLSCIKPKVGA